MKTTYIPISIALVMIIIIASHQVFAQFMAVNNETTMSSQEQLKLARERLATQQTTTQPAPIGGGENDIMPGPSFWDLNPWAGLVVVVTIIGLVAAVWKLLSKKE